MGFKEYGLYCSKTVHHPPDTPKIRGSAAVIIDTKRGGCLYSNVELKSCEPCNPTWEKDGSQITKINFPTIQVLCLKGPCWAHWYFLRTSFDPKCFHYLHSFSVPLLIPLWSWGHAVSSILFWKASYEFALFVVSNQTTAIPYLEIVV